MHQPHTGFSPPFPWCSSSGGSRVLSGGRRAVACSSILGTSLSFCVSSVSNIQRLGGKIKGRWQEVLLLDWGNLLSNLGSYYAYCEARAHILVFLWCSYTSLRRLWLQRDLLPRPPTSYPCHKPLQLSPPDSFTQLPAFVTLFGVVLCNSLPTS